MCSLSCSLSCSLLISCSHFLETAIATYVSLANAEPDDGYAGKASSTSWSRSPSVCLLACALRAVRSRYLAPLRRGGLRARALHPCMSDGGTIKSRTGRIILFTVLMVTGVLFAIIFKTTLFTAFVGAFSVILGVDTLAPV
jgi:hypothetical protein